MRSITRSAVTSVVLLSFFLLATSGCGFIKSFMESKDPLETVDLLIQYASQIRGAIRAMPHTQIYKEFQEAREDLPRFAVTRAIVQEPQNVPAVPDREGLRIFEGATATKVNDITLGNTVHYTEWKIEHSALSGGQVMFWSLRICEDGLPQNSNDPKRCAHVYHGVKVDGSQTLKYFKEDLNRPGQYTGLVLVFEPKEQWAARLITFNCVQAYILGMASC